MKEMCGEINANSNKRLFDGSHMNNNSLSEEKEKELRH